MTRPRDIFKVYLQLSIQGTNNLEWVDFTEGIINIDIKRGVDEYIGRWQYTDIGQLTLTSRNNALDPEVNNAIRLKRNIKVHVYDSVTGIEQPLFEGKINNVDVQYLPRNEKPIITLTAFDMVADLNNATLTQAQATAIETAAGSQTVNVYDIVNYLEANPSIVPNWRKSPNVANDNTPEETDDMDYLVGRSYYDVFSIKSNGFLGFWYIDRNNAFAYRDRDKPSTTAQFATFSSDPTTGQLPFKTFDMVDGYERIYNSFRYPQSYTATPNPTPVFETYEVPGSIDYWGKREATIEYNRWLGNIPLIRPENSGGSDDIAGFAIESAFPHREINSMTWDGMKDVNKAALTDINNNIRLIYSYGDISIDRRYGVVGVQHFITPETWEVKYVLRNWFYVFDSGDNPAIVSDVENTDNLTAVNFSISNSDLFDSVLWDFGDGTSSTSFTPSKKYSSPAVPSSTYNVTCTGTNFLGAQKVSNTISITVTGAAPQILDTSNGAIWLDPFFGHLYPTARSTTVSGFDTLSWDVNSLTMGTNGPLLEPMVTKLRDIPPQPLIVGGPPLPSTATPSKFSANVTLTATNSYGSTSHTYGPYTNMSVNLFQQIPSPALSARYIKVQHKKRVSPMYMYTHPSTWNTSNNNVIIANIVVTDTSGNDIATGAQIIQLDNLKGPTLNNNGTQVFYGTVDKGILTDGNKDTWLNLKTNKFSYSSTYPMGPGWRVDPDWTVVIDLGSIYTNIASIDVQFVTDIQAGDLTQYPYPFKTKSVTTEDDTGILISYKSNILDTVPWEDHYHYIGVDGTSDGTLTWLKPMSGQLRKVPT